jgi:hypothetical protein
MTATESRYFERSRVGRDTPQSRHFVEAQYRSLKRQEETNCIAANNRD